MQVGLFDSTFNLIISQDLFKNVCFKRIVWIYVEKKKYRKKNIIELVYATGHKLFFGQPGIFLKDQTNNKIFKSLKASCWVSKSLNGQAQIVAKKRWMPVDFIIQFIFIIC